MALGNHITIRYAHGLRDIFKHVDEEHITALKKWLLGGGDTVLRFPYDGDIYFMNRDLVASMKIHRNKEEADLIMKDQMD